MLNIFAGKRAKTSCIFRKDAYNMVLEQSQCKITCKRTDLYRRVSRMELITVGLFVTVLGMVMRRKGNEHLADFLSQDN